MTRPPLLQLRAIEKRFPGVQALRGVSLDVHAGEVVALLGENGAGKSTLMKIVGGIEQPDAGEVLIDGAPVVVRGVSGATALGIAFIHQELNLLDNLDVAGNVLLGREPTGWGVLRLIDRAKMRETVRPYLDQLGLDVSPDTPLAALSIARRQLVEIAKALSLNARLLIMDEPTSSLTIAEAGRLHEVVASLRERGAAVIYITHRLGEVRDRRRPCDRLARRRERRHAGARGELTHDNMIWLMVGRQIDLEHDAASAQKEDREYFRVDGLRTRRYPQHAVSFAVGRGEIVGMAGLVGAGRSEIALALFGDRPADRRNREPRRTAAADRDARGRHPSRDLSRSRGSQAGRASWWISRFARTCRSRRSADTRGTASSPRRRNAGPWRRSAASCRSGLNRWRSRRRP